LSLPPPERSAASLLRWGRIIGLFTTAQVFIQALGALAGLVIVRLLDKDQYALFTIASSFQTSANLLTDCGINAGLLSMGGKVWGDRQAAGRLVSAALRLRLRLVILGALIIAPLSLWLLTRNGASIGVAVGITVLIVATLQLMSAAAIFAAILKLNSRYSRLQLIDASTALARLGAIILAASAALSALLAMIATTAGQLLQYVTSRRAASTLYQRGAAYDAAQYGQLLALVKSNIAFSIYVAVQGQIAIFILGFSGTSTEVADIGALTRIGIIAALVTSVLNYVVSPIFARANHRAVLERALAATFIGVTALSTALLASCMLFPSQILWIFGPQYMHLRHELVLTALSLAMSLNLATLWTINTARAWLHGTWLLVPATVALQFALACLLDLSSVAQTLWFTILSQIPNLLWSAMLTRRGLKELAAVPPEQGKEKKEC
jgi:O-antigen/teichoic acid export membrane protein